MDLDNLPPGYRFCPYDLELFQYLEKKVKNEPLPPNRIMEVNLYKFTPEQLQGLQPVIREELREPEMYFFTQRERKYLNGIRPNRVTGPGSGFGYWKATAADQEVKSKDKLVGFKKTLVFYRRTNPEDHKGKKTNWIMHEFRVGNPSKKDGTDMKLDWVLCRIHKNVRKNTDLDSEKPSTEMPKPLRILSVDVNAYSENTQQPLQNYSLEIPQTNYTNNTMVDSIQYVNPIQTNDSTRYCSGAPNSIQYAGSSQAKELQSMANDFCSYYNGAANFIQYSDPSQGEALQSMANDFASYDNGAANSIQYHGPSQGEALQSMANDFTSHCNGATNSIQYYGPRQGEAFQSMTNDFAGHDKGEALQSMANDFAGHDKGEALQSMANDFASHDNGAANSIQYHGPRQGEALQSMTNDFAGHDNGAANSMQYYSPSLGEALESLANDFASHDNGAANSMQYYSPSLGEALESLANDFASHDNGAANSVQYYVPSLGEALEPLANDFASHDNGATNSIQYSGPGQAEALQSMANDFSSYYNGAANSMQYAGPSQTEVFESMASRERRNYNMPTQAHASYDSADSMHQPRQNRFSDVPEWSNNTAAIDDEIGALEAYFGTSAAGVEAFSVQPPTLTGFEDDNGILKV